MLLDKWQRAFSESPKPFRGRHDLHQMMFIHVLQFCGVEDGAAVSDDREIELRDHVSTNDIYLCAAGWLTLWIISSMDMMVVLSGACFEPWPDEEVDGPEASCWTPHPAKASQFKTALGSQPRC